MKQAKNKVFELPDRVMAYILSASGIIGLLAAFILSVEKVELLKDPSFEPSCNINPILSCGSVMITPQAELFGFPNPFLGIIGFTAVAVTGFSLLAGAAYRRWYWRGLLAGVSLALIFVHWLIFQSLYRIGALCPYCMVVWSVTIPLFWYLLLYSFQKGYLTANGKIAAIVNFGRRHHGDILLAWILVIIVLILNRFWYYWSSLV